MKMIEIKDGARTIYKHVPDDWTPEDEKHKDITGDLTTSERRTMGYTDIPEEKWNKIFKKGKSMKVLSLFDGIACGRLAFERAGIPVEKYYASEVDKYAIQVAQKNYPDIIQIGDVTKVDFEKYKDVDIVIGGSPCQGFSFAGKQLNFNDPRSKLFFEFVRAVKTINPKYFLLENVKMKQEFQDIISEQLGVKPVEINSSLVSAQNRKRLYWTNIPGITKPEDKGIMLKDIVHEFADIPEKSLMTSRNFEHVNRPFGSKAHDVTDEEKSPTLQAAMGMGGGNIPYRFEWLQKYVVPFDLTIKILDKEVERGKVGYFRKDSQANRIYYIHDKAVTLCGDAGGGAAKMGQYLFGCIPPDRIEKRQNGQRFNEGDKFYTLTAQDKHGVLVEGYIRKLTPIECERLQTLPDNYTSGISDSQRYKALGNGWTVDVIAHILKGLK